MIVERIARYMVSSIRRITLRLQERKVVFSLIGVYDAHVLVFCMTPTIPICCVDDGPNS